MSHPIKLKPEEFSEIKSIKSKFERITYNFGLLQIERMDLDNAISLFVEKDKDLKKEWESLVKLEESLINKIIQTYGEGNLNMEDGTFTPKIEDSKM